MQYELDEKDKDDWSVTHEEWCDILSTIEAKDKRKRAVDQTKRLAVSKEAPGNYDSNTSAKVPCNKKARTGVLLACKHQG